MDFALAAVVLAPGLALGSFLNVVAARLPLRRSIVRPPSACMSCGQEILWYDNVPLLSYALLRGIVNVVVDRVITLAPESREVVREVEARAREPRVSARR